MTNLTQFFPKSSESPVGEIRVVVGGITQSPATITTPDGSVWLRENAMYPIAEYPEAAERFYGAGGAYTFSNLSFTPVAVTSTGMPRVVLFGDGKVFTGTNFDDCQRSTNGTNSLQNFAAISAVANSINSGSYGSGRFVIGGDANRVATSTNLVTWTSTSGLVSSQNIEAVAAGNNVWMASVTAQSLSGTNMARSTDGTTWANIVSPWYSGSRCMTYGDGKFAAVNRFGRVEWSTDGLTWTGPNLLNGNSGDRYCNEFAYADGTYVGVGDNTSVAGARGMILTSTDGEYWTARSSGLNLVYNTVTYGAGRWVAGASSGYIATSTDAITWSTQTVGASFTINKVIYTDKFIAVGDAQNIRTSTDGLTWTARTPGVTGTFNDLAYNGSVVVYVGNNGLLGYSTDGITWVNNYSGSVFQGSTMLHIAYGNGVFIATGTNTRVMKSTDGISWSVSAPITAVEGYVSGSPYIAYNSAEGIFGVHFVDPSRENITIYTSTNGDSWATKTIQSGVSSNSNSGYMRLFGWSAANGKFIGIGDYTWSGGIYMTATGDTWNHLPMLTPSSTATFNSIAYGNGRWVVVSGSPYNNIWTSTNLRDWQFVPNPQTSYNYLNQTILKVDYNTSSGLWMYCGNRTLACSTDALSWRPLAQNLGNLTTTATNSGYNWITPGAGSSWYTVGYTYPSTTQTAFWGYTPDPTIPYSPYWDAGEYFFVPKISQSTYTVGTTLTGTQNTGQMLATYNTEAVVYVKGK